MTILALDTSTPAASLALVDQGNLVVESNPAPGETHSKTLLPRIREMLDDTGLEIRDLEFIAVGLGPGSFTGLRIGLAAVKGLAWAGGVPLVGVPTLDAMVQAITPDHLAACPVIDARKDQLYAAMYRPSTLGGWDRKSDYSSFTLTGLGEAVREKTIFIGQGLNKWGEKLAGLLGDFYQRGPEKYDYPRAKNIARLAREIVDRGEIPAPSTVTPLYVRPPDIREPKKAGAARE